MTLLRRLAKSNPLPVALAAEGLLIPLALGLAWLLGQSPGDDFQWSPGTPLLAVAFTAPLIALLALFMVLRPGWFRELERIVRPAVAALFHGHGRWAVVAAALLAGFGEELLFRGVLQAWLVAGTGPWPGLLLAALIFGALHPVTLAYFVLAAVMGLYLGAIYQFTGDLLLASLVHALYDWVAIEILLRQVDRDPDSG